ncbi:MAG: hypothetical protein LBH21_08240 [Gracilibacteraceae bacterium]|nr:hypothetical protein [Gracilibacteraceae bacterium]
MKTYSKTTIYVAVIAMALLIAGLQPLAKAYLSITRICDRLTQTSLILNGHIACISFSGENWQENMNLVREELAGSNDDFLGIYPYPDLEMFTEIYRESELISSYGFVTFEYNPGLEALQLIELKEGELFAFREYDATEELPVIVTENSPLRVGDKLILHRWAGMPREAVKRTAVVAAIAYDNIAVPFATQGFGREFYKETADAFTVYLPEGHGMYRNAPDRYAKVNAYALFKSQPSQSDIEIVGQYGIWDDMEMMMEVLGGDELIEYINRRIPVYLIPFICCSLAGAMLIVFLLFGFFKNIYHTVGK